MSPTEIVLVVALSAYAVYQQSRVSRVDGGTRFKMALIYGVVGLAVGGIDLPSGTAGYALLAASIVLSVVVGLARGRLTREWDAATARSETDEFGKTLYGEGDQQVVERVAQVAEQRGVPRAQVALAWVLAQPVVTSPIIGATKLSHLEDAAAAAELVLSPDEIALLEEPYRPHEVAGFA